MFCEFFCSKSSLHPDENLKQNAFPTFEINDFESMDICFGLLCPSLMSRNKTKEQLFDYWGIVNTCFRLCCRAKVSSLHLGIRSYISIWLESMFWRTVTQWHRLDGVTSFHIIPIKVEVMVGWLGEPLRSDSVNIGWHRWLTNLLVIHTTKHLRLCKTNGAFRGAYVHISRVQSTSCRSYLMSLQNPFIPPAYDVACLSASLSVCLLSIFFRTFLSPFYISCHLRTC